MKFTLYIGIGNEYLPHGDLEYVSKAQQMLDSVNIAHGKYCDDATVVEARWDLEYHLGNTMEFSEKLHLLVRLFSETEILHARIWVPVSLWPNKHLRVRNLNCFVLSLKRETSLVVHLRCRAEEEKIATLNELANKFLKLAMQAGCILNAQEYVTTKRNLNAATQKLNKSYLILGSMLEDL